METTKSTAREGAPGAVEQRDLSPVVSLHANNKDINYAGSGHDVTSKTFLEKQSDAHSADVSSANDDFEVPLLGPEPTPEEEATLRKVADHVPLRAWLVAVVELSERFTFYGLSGVFQNYMQRERSTIRQSYGYGGLGLPQSSATALSYFFQFFCYITPVFGGLISDLVLGKYRTILVSALIYMLGNLVLFLSSLPVSIDHGHAKGGLVAAMIIIGLGTGGIKANVSTLIAEQYTNTKMYVKTLKSGERVIVDPSTTLQTLFMLFYFCINVGSLSGIATTQLELHVDFWAAFLLPLCFFVICIVVLIIGRNCYIRRPPQGSPIPRAFKIIGMGFKNYFNPIKGLSKHIEPKAPREDNLLKPDVALAFKTSFFAGFSAIFSFPNYYLRKVWYKMFPSRDSHGNPKYPRFTLDVCKPSIREELGLEPVPWNDQFVDEVKRAVIACKVFVFFPIYWVVYGQMLNNFVSQAAQMEVHKIPNDIMQNINPICIIIFVPIMERLVYPTLRRFGITLYPISRIFFGFMFASMAMAYAAIVQHLIYNAGPCYNEPLKCDAGIVDGQIIPNRVHVAVQTPAYLFIALSEIMANITGLEYAYTKAPAPMKAFIMSLYLLTTAFGSAIGMALAPTAQDPKLMWMYTGLAAATVIAGILFWFIYNHLNKVERQLNYLDAEVVGEENARLVEENRIMNLNKPGALHLRRKAPDRESHGRNSTTMRPTRTNEFTAKEEALIMNAAQTKD